MKQRYLALDFLRGLSIFGMVFSALVPSGVLPGWMYHVQNPPPSHQLDMQAAGIGWVDLVFPVFIFCMGAAIPLSGRKKIQKGLSCIKFLKSAAARSGMLWLFSYLYVLLNYSDVPGFWPQFFTLLGFCALFPLYMVCTGEKMCRYAVWVRLGALAAVCGIIAVGHFQFGEAVNLQRRGIILFLLAFLYLFGSVIWYFTRDHLKSRAAVFGLILAVMLATQYEGLPAAAYANDGIRWWFNPEYIYFLLVLLPATYVGDILYKTRYPDGNTYLSETVRLCRPEKEPEHKKTFLLFYILLLCWVIWACYAFYMRLYWWNLGVGAGMAAVLWRRVPHKHSGGGEIFAAGAYLLLCGLLLDNLDGGIKKVPCTVSYCFAAGGLGIFLFMLSEQVCRRFTGSLPVRIFSGAGQNPLMSYIAFDNLVLPFMKATGLIYLYREAYPAGYPLAGVLRAAAITLFTMWLVSLFSKKKVFWKA